MGTKVVKETRLGEIKRLASRGRRENASAKRMETVPTRSSPIPIEQPRKVRE